MSDDFKDGFDSLAIHLDSLEELASPLSESKLPLAENSFQRDETRVVSDKSGIFMRKKTDKSQRSLRSAPLGFERGDKRNPEFDGFLSPSEVDRSRRYFRESVFQQSRDSNDTFSPTQATDSYIENNVSGGINTLIHVIKLFEENPLFLQRHNVQKIIDKYKQSRLSATTLKTIGLELSANEAKFYGLSDFEISQLERFGIINDDRAKMIGDPFIHRGISGEKLILKHFDNLVQVQKANVENKKLSGVKNYLFRIQDRMPILTRYEVVIDLGSILRVNLYLCLPDSTQKRYPQILE